MVAVIEVPRPAATGQTFDVTLRQAGRHESFNCWSRPFASPPVARTNFVIVCGECADQQLDHSQSRQRDVNPALSWIALSGGRVP